MFTIIIILLIASMVVGAILEASGGVTYDDDCPYCSSGDTDGNHCYTCDEDF